MPMLEKKTYTRKELIELFKTERLDAIKKKIERMRYQYTTSGRGKTFSLTITDLPYIESFKDYCLDKLGFDPHTDFNKLKYFIYYCLNDDEFITLNYNHIQERLCKTNNIYISTDTISLYMERLKEHNLIYSDLMDFTYYKYDIATKRTKYITKEQFNDDWKKFYKKIDELSDEKAKDAVKKEIKLLPKKKPKNQKNIFYADEYQRLQELIEKEL